MNKQEIYEYLNQQHIWYEVTEHKAVYNMEDLSDVEIPYPQADAKNLFVCDNKKQNLLSDYSAREPEGRFKGISKGKWNASVKFCLGRRFN